MAQLPGPAADLLKRVRAANQTRKVSYDYDIRLSDKTLKHNLDSIMGKASYDGSRFTDSNSAFFTAFNTRYYCKLNHRRKLFLVYDVAVIRKRMHLEQQDNNNTLDLILSDSLLAHYGAAAVDTTQKDSYRITIRPKDQQISLLQCDLRRSDYKITAALVEQEEKDPDDETHVYARTYHIFNIQYAVDDRVFDIGRLFSIADGKTVVNKKYTNYTLTEVLK